MKRAFQAIWTSVWIVAFILSSPASGHAAQVPSYFCANGPNNYCWNFGLLPSLQGWTYFQGGSIPETGPSGAFATTPTSLIQHTVGTGFTGGANPNYELPDVVNGTQPFVLIVQAQITDYEGTQPFGFFFDVRTATPNQEYAIGFTPSEVTDPLGNSVAIDTMVTHTYVLRAIPGHPYTLNIYGMDGTKEATLTGPPSATGGALDAVQIGDGNATGANADAVVTRLEFWQGNPMIIPTTGDLTQAFLEPVVHSKPLKTSYYDQLDQQQAQPTTRLHSGVDISAHVRCTQTSPYEVVAAAAGIVKEAGLAGSGGTKVIIDHGVSLSPSGKFIFTEYFHMCKIKVQPGQSVIAGQVLGYQSDKGAPGVNLHWDIRVSQTDIAPGAPGWQNVPYASPDFYTCVPLTWGDTQPPLVNHVNAGENLCWM